MNVESICLFSKVIDLSENEAYLQLQTRLCYYDDKNLNGVMLPYKGVEDTALENAQTLVNMPVQARYKKVNNQDDLGSHEARLNPDGSIEFGTESIGTHTAVEIKDDTVTTVSGEEKILPCLFATCRIWKRNKNMISAIKRLYESDEGLNSSWEIATTSYEFTNGVKILKDYYFLANCFLGSNVTPAYKGTSKTLSLSSLSDQELLVAEALSQDLIESGAFDINENEAKEEENLQGKNEKTVAEEASVETPVADTAEQVNENETSETTNEVVDSGNTETSDESKENETAETSEETSTEVTENTSDETSTENTETSEESGTNNTETSENTTETSALTMDDLWRKLNIACRAKTDSWCWVSFVFPEEKEVWAEYDGESELDFLRFTYSVENDEVTVSEPEKIRLQASIRTINSTISEYEKTISEKDELIVKASSEINSLKAENTELSQYKEKLTQIEQEKADAELTKKKEELIASVVKSGQVTRKEIEQSEELTNYVNTLDKKSLMALVGERLSASMESNSETQVETSSVEVSEHTLSNLNDDDDIIDKVSVMRDFLKK